MSEIKDRVIDSNVVQEITSLGLWKLDARPRVWSPWTQWIQAMKIWGWSRSDMKSGTSRIGPYGDPSI